MSVAELTAVGMLLISAECRAPKGLARRALVRQFDRVLDALQRQPSQEARDAYDRLYRLWCVVG